MRDVNILEASSEAMPTHELIFYTFPRIAACAVCGFCPSIYLVTSPPRSTRSSPVGSLPGKPFEASLHGFLRMPAHAVNIAVSSGTLMGLRAKSRFSVICDVKSTANDPS
jgi:hypothetical protein